MPSSRRRSTRSRTSEHRGAEGADPKTGADGAGILLQIPDTFMRGAVAGVELPPLGRYGVGVCYLPDRTPNSGSRSSR